MRLLVIFPLVTIGLLAMQLARPPEGPRQMRGSGARFVATEHAAPRESPLSVIWEDTRTWVVAFVTGRTSSDLEDLHARQSRQMKGPTVRVPDLSAMIAEHHYRVRNPVKRTPAQCR